MNWEVVAQQGKTFAAGTIVILCAIAVGIPLIDKRARCREFVAWMWHLAWRVVVVLLVVFLSGVGIAVALA